MGGERGLVLLRLLTHADLSGTTQHPQKTSRRAQMNNALTTEPCVFLGLPIIFNILRKTHPGHCDFSRLCDCGGLENGFI
jgi:hypothetical protein